MPGYNQDVDPHADYNTAARNWKKKTQKLHRAEFLLLFFFPLLEHFIFELELFTQLKSILAGCTFTFVSKALVLFFCVFTSRPSGCGH